MDYKRILITGINGSGASYLTEHIVQKYPHVDIHGTQRWSSHSNSNLSEMSNNITIHESDLNDFPSTITTIELIKPDAIVHLASKANVGISHKTPISFLTNNVIGTANLLEAIKLSCIECRFLMCGSSEVYGNPNEKDYPMHEDIPFRPVSSYAVSKASQELLANSYYYSYGMDVVITRMFSYFNPRRGDLFATSFANQVALIEMGIKDKLYHGNLDSVRNILDVRDAMSAYCYALRECHSGEAYNIGSTNIVKVADFLRYLINLSSSDIPTEPDMNLFRPKDVVLQVPSIDKFTDTTGWKPKFSYEDSVSYMLEKCRINMRDKYGQGTKLYPKKSKNN